MSAPPSHPRRARAERYPTDPPSARSTGKPVIERSVFDVDRYMSALKAGLIEGIGPQDHPSDDLLVSTVVALGCPRWAAEQMRSNPALRLAYYGMWTAVQEAARGDKEAQEVVDVARAYWQQARREELVSDAPDGSVGLWER